MIDLVYATEIELELELDAETDYQNELSYQLDDMAAFFEYEEELRNKNALAWQANCDWIAELRNKPRTQPRTQPRRSRHQQVPADEWDHEYFMSIKPATPAPPVDDTDLPF